MSAALVRRLREALRTLSSSHRHMSAMEHSPCPTPSGAFNLQRFTGHSMRMVPAKFCSVDFAIWHPLSDAFATNVITKNARNDKGQNLTEAQSLHSKHEQTQVHAWTTICKRGGTTLPGYNVPWTAQHATCPVCAMMGSNNVVETAK